MKKINSNSINKYWNKYYKITPFDKQSNFANFVLRKLSIKKKITLADIACGNGRDTVFFHKHGLNIIGFDHSEIIIKNNIKKFGNFFIKINFCKKNLKLNKKFDVFYIRFFFHAITEKMENEFLLNLKKTSKKKSIFFCEFRTNKDPLIKKGVKISKYERFTTHYRRFIELNSFKKKLDHNKFKIIYEKTSNKFAIKKKEKPSICRMIFFNA
jgi:ubiquinone/menaquinone biosynthesis C-methylase UbiE